jgi:hypothetical protein
MDASSGVYIRMMRPAFACVAEACGGKESSASVSAAVIILLLCSCHTIYVSRTCTRCNRQCL